MWILSSSVGESEEAHWKRSRLKLLFWSSDTFFCYLAHEGVSARLVSSIKSALMFLQILFYFDYILPMKMSMNHNWVQCFDRHLLTNLLNECQWKMLEKQNAASRFTNSLSRQGFFGLSRSEHQSKMSSFNVRGFWHKQMFFPQLSQESSCAKGPTRL